MLDAKNRPPQFAGGREERRLIDYCTVSAMVVFWLRVPEVAVMVTIRRPAGVAECLPDERHRSGQVED